MNVSVLIIGDAHFKARCVHEGQDFVDRCVTKAKKYRPTFIVCLGDTLDTHEVGRVQPYNTALDFVERLSEVAPVYLIVGNHDLINNQQFLTPNHFFNALKKWQDVHVVDRPMWREYGSFHFVFCPYVPPGRFVEALNELTRDDEAWDLADCIFAHQEFAGCKMGAIESQVGDEWDENYPPVISGHIHDAQTVEPNIYYPGSAIQHAFGESPDKRIWFVVFGHTEEPPYFSIQKVSLGMKGKKMVYMDIDAVEKFDFRMLKKYHVKLSLRGTNEQFKVFRRGNFHSRLTEAGVKIAYSPVQATREDMTRRTRAETSYLGMLRELVRAKSEEVRAVFNEVLKERLDASPDASPEASSEGRESNEGLCELVFEDD